MSSRSFCLFAFALALANLDTASCFLGHQAMIFRRPNPPFCYPAYFKSPAACQMTVKLPSKAMNPFDALAENSKLRMPAIKDTLQSTTNRVTLGGADIELCRLIELVEAKGGPEEVTQKKQWGTLARELGLDTKILRNISSRLKVAYLSLLMNKDHQCKLDPAALEKPTSAAGPRKGKPLLQLVETDRQDQPCTDQGKSEDKSKRTTTAASKASSAKERSKSKVLLVRNISGSVALPDEVEDDVAAIATQYLTDEIGVEEKNIDKILESCPQLQGLSVRDNLRPTVKFLVKEVGIGIEKMRKIIVCFPQLLGLSIKENLRPTVKYLVEDVGISQEKLNKTIFTHPQLLAYSVDNNLRPKLLLLQQHADIPKARLADVITRCPQVLGYSEGHILAFIKYLSEELGIERSKLARIITYSPQLIGLSVESNLRPKIRFLVEEAGIPKSSIGKVISAYPNILGYSVENNMRPKLMYLSEHLLRVPMHRIGRPLLKCPQLLGYSLEKRIKPRHMLLAKRGLRLGLSRMLAPTDVEFRRILRMHDAQHQEEIRSSREAAKSIRSSPAQLNPNRQSSHPPSEILQLLSVEFPAGYLQWTREGTKKLEGVVSTDSRYRVPARSSRVQVSATRRSGRERTGAADSKAMEIYLELSNGARKVRATINRQLQALELSVEQIQSSSRRTRRAPPACEVRLTDQEASHVIRQYCDEGRREEGGGASREAPVYYWHGSQDDDV